MNELNEKVCAVCGKPLEAHNWDYYLEFGSIPGGKDVDHLPVQYFYFFCSREHRDMVSNDLSDVVSNILMKYQLVEGEKPEQWKGSGFDNQARTGQ